MDFLTYKKGVEAYENELQQQNAMIDGVVDQSLYFHSTYRIAWFLKEAYTTEDPYHIRKYYGSPDAYEKFFKNTATTTWHPIIYSTYGILNNFMKWEDLAYIRYKPEMCDVVKQIAIINANKAPSETGTYTLYKNLNEGFKKYQKITEAQIETLKPQVHIFCSTFDLYKDYFGITVDNLISIDSSFENFSAFEKEGNLFLAVFHPANRVQKREIYINQIISAVENWTKMKTYPR